MHDPSESKTMQAPLYTPKKVLGNGAFGKYIYTELIKMKASYSRQSTS